MKKQMNSITLETTMKSLTPIRYWTRSVWPGALALMLAPTLLAQNAYVYPAKGQSPEQTEKDKAECFAWAKKESGFDPSQPAAVASAPQSGGQVVQGGARGAAVGAVGGAIAGDAGKGAAIGAASGALIGGVRRRSDTRNQQAQQTQQQAASDQGRAAFDRAYKACLTGKGYTVQ